MREALAPGATVSELVRRHDLRPQQLFGWLHEERKAAEPPPAYP
jgi:transposase